MASKPIYFVRHGRTEWNLSFRFQGSSDVPLNDLGRNDALRYIDLLQAYFAATGEKMHFSGVVSSPLLRAKETASLVCAGLGGARVGLPSRAELIPSDVRLQEQYYGLWEGLSIDEIRRRFPGSIEARMQDVRNFTADGGEPVTSLMQRVSECIDALPPGTLVFGHFGTLFGLLLQRWNGELKDFPRITQDAIYLIFNDDVLRVDTQYPLGRSIKPGPDLDPTLPRARY